MRYTDQIDKVILNTQQSIYTNTLQRIIQSRSDSTATTKD